MGERLRGNQSVIYNSEMDRDSLTSAALCFAIGRLQFKDYKVC